MTMTAPSAAAGILLIDDGELDEVALVLESEGLAYDRMRGGHIPAQVAPPRDLLIVTPRRVERVRPANPADARPERPLRIIAIGEDSPAMRAQLRRAGLDLLVRMPADAEIWRLLIARALYQGGERRDDERIAIGSPVAIAVDADASETESKTMLIDLSNRGCRLRTDKAFQENDPIAITLPTDSEAGREDEPLTLRGQVRRIAFESGSDQRALAVAFDAGMPESSRTRLAALINRWASGSGSKDSAPDAMLPAIPPCQLPSLPDLTLDDETDPPVAAGEEIRVVLTEVEGNDISTTDAERRSLTRGQFESPLVAEGQNGRVVLIGRDLSAGGMRIERGGHLELGDRFRIGLHSPVAGEPFVVQAEIIRDDGDEGFALVFDKVAPRVAVELEKLVACLPDVESLDDGEIGGLGAILSEIMVD
jgi:hypothetical protein